MDDISIAIVAYNNYDDIVNAVKSIEEYTDANIVKTIYIIDNSASNKEMSASRKELLALTDIYSDLKYINPGSNLGFGSGHNYIIDLIDSKFHAIVNPDILLTEDTFSVLIKFMQDNDIGMAIPKIVDTDGNIQQVYRRELTVYDMFIRMFCKVGFKKRKAYHTMQDMDYTKPFHVPFGQGSFLFIKTDLFRELHGFDERFFMYVEDADLCKRVNEVSEFMYCPYTQVIHKWEKGSHKNKKLFKYHLDSIKLYFKKWGWKLR